MNNDPTKKVLFVGVPADAPETTTKTPLTKSRSTKSMKMLAVKIQEMETMNASLFEMERQASDQTQQTDIVDEDESDRNVETPAASEKNSSRPKRKTVKKLGIKVKKLGVALKNAPPKIKRKRGAKKDKEISAKYFNAEEDDEKERELMKKQALEATLLLIREHLDEFVEENPNGSYEQWIEELHPENAQSRRNVVNGKRIDHRFYVEESDHRKLWNNSIGGGPREFVPTLAYAGE